MNVVSKLRYRKDDMPSILSDYMDAASVFHWATKRHYTLWFTGSAPKRHRRSEIILKKLSNKGKLKSVHYGRTLAYSTRSDLEHIKHGLATTECLVRFYRSKMDGIVIAEKYFRGLGSVPEFGILYPNGTMLLCEFSTKDNYLFSGLMRSKYASYKKNLERIEERFNARAAVVFIVDVPRTLLKPSDYFMCDYETFLKVPLGQALDAPIYLWSDGESHRLRK